MQPIWKKVNAQIRIESWLLNFVIKQDNTFSSLFYNHDCHKPLIWNNMGGHPLSSPSLWTKRIIRALIHKENFRKSEKPYKFLLNQWVVGKLNQNARGDREITSDRHSLAFMIWRWSSPSSIHSRFIFKWNILLTIWNLGLLVLHQCKTQWGNQIKHQSTQV